MSPQGPVEARVSGSGEVCRYGWRHFATRRSAGVPTIEKPAGDPIPNVLAWRGFVLCYLVPHAMPNCDDYRAIPLTLRAGCDLKRSGPRDCSRSAATVSWVGHRRCRPRAKLSCALGKAEISAVKNAHIIACAGSDIVRGRRFPGFKQQRHHMVSLAPNSFLMNYGSRQGPLR